MPVTFILLETITDAELPEFDNITRKIDHSVKDFFQRLFEGQWHKHFIQQDYRVPTNLLEWCLPLAEAVPEDDQLLVRVRFLGDPQKTKSD